MTKMTNHDATRNTHTPTVHCSPLTLIALATLIFIAALALNLSPYLRGPTEWRWAYAIPGQPARLWISALALALYLALASVWVMHITRKPYPPRWQTRGFLICLMLAVPLIQASLLALDYSDVLVPVFYRTVSADASGVFSVGSTIEDGGDFLRHYPTLMPTLPVHPQRYPPGLPLLFYLARRLLEQTPALAETLGFRLRLYQCHDLTLMRLSNASISSAIIQMVLPLVSGLVLLPIYGLARRAYGRRTAAWAVALYPLVPSFALWSGRWEQFYPLLVCTAWYFFHISLTHPRRSTFMPSTIYSLAAGLTMSIASMLNFGNLALLLPMALFALFWLLTRPSPISNLQSLIPNLLAFLIGLGSLWAIYRLAFGTGFFDVWRVSMSYHLGLNRSYWTWLVYHLYDFFIFLGLPLALLFLVALVKAIRDLLTHYRRYHHLLFATHHSPFTTRHSPLTTHHSLFATRHSPFPIPHSPFPIDPLTLGFALGLLILNLSGTSRGEVARVWLFLTPFAALIAARGLELLHAKQRNFILVASLLALQLFTFNTYLRVVTTGLTAPPASEHSFEPPSIAHPLSARFGDSIALLGYDLEQELPSASGETERVLHLTLYWESLKPMARPYTVFTHLVGPDGQLAGQQDNMPLRDTAPTTCWLPGEVFADPYDISIGPQATPGDYTLETGFYFWETGARLPVTGPAAALGHRVILTQVPIGEKR
ncbi:MAG: hypothetical protein SWK90_19715 [Chloroflexota bacterium]|nr:hypothetical protein [Chloroflexota bacterium]